MSTVKLNDQDLFEIRADVKRAKYKNEQIRIEAQLYAVSVSTIKKIINGEDIYEATEHGQIYKCGYNPHKKKKEEAMRLILKGVPFNKIQVMTGLSKPTIRKYATKKEVEKWKIIIKNEKIS